MIYYGSTQFITEAESPSHPGFEVSGRAEMPAHAGYICMECGALVSRPRVHADFHAELRALSVNAQSAISQSMNLSMIETMLRKIFDQVASMDAIAEREAINSIRKTAQEIADRLAPV